MRPDRSEHASTTNLPVGSSSFVGRVADLDEIAERFEEGARLVTITGLGGMGKTRLALTFARAQTAAYSAGDGGGAWFVDLSEARDASALLIDRDQKGRL